jgi:hypothetical protein
MWKSAPATDYRFLDIISEHPGQGGEGEEKRKRYIE